MNKYLSIVAADLKNTRRDPTLLLLLWMPVLMIFAVRHGLPALGTYLPDVKNYYLEIVTFFALLNCVFPGFVLSFILLDEKDLYLIPVIHVTPVSYSGFLIVRIVFLGLYGFACSWAIFAFNGLISISVLQNLMASLLCALNTPIMILLISTKAKNKIEGLTLLKVANVALMIPGIVFFINSPWENLLAVFPAFWVYLFFDVPDYQWLIFTIGIVVLLVINRVVFSYAIKKNL